MRRKQTQNQRDLVSKYNASKYVNHPKLKLSPVVEVERCDFSHLADFNPSLSPSKMKLRRHSTKTNVESTLLPQMLDPSDLLQPVQRVQKKMNQDSKGNSSKCIVVHLERCQVTNASLPIEKKIDYTENDTNQEKRQIKRKRCKFKSNPQYINAKTQQSNANAKKTVLQCSNDIRNKNDNPTLQLQKDNKKVLRERRKVDYKEKLSIGTPELKPKTLHRNSARIPIYNQLNFTETLPKEGKYDQFDFIPESDEDKGSDVSFHIQTPAKKRKLIKMVHINKKRANIIKDKENNLMKTKKGNKHVTYRGKVENVMNNIRNKINNKNDNIKVCRQIKASKDSQTEQNSKFNVFKNTDNEIINMNLVFNSTQVPDTQNISLPNESLIAHYEERVESNKMNKKQELLSITCNRQHQNNANINLNEEVVPEKHQEGYADFSDAVERGNLISGRSSSASNYTHDISEVLDSSGNLFQCHFSGNAVNILDKDKNADSLFGFDEDIEEEEVQKKTKTGRVNVIENLVLTKGTIPTESSLLTRQPIRKSWRFHMDYLSRNPHFIDVKRDGLPSLNQDAVLDHTFDERIEKVNTTISVPHTKKAPKQRSILNYIDNNKDHFDENHPTPCLFNIEEYSPIKTNKTNKENFDENVMKGPKRVTRRNILGQINENIMTNITSTPTKYKNRSGPIQIDLSLIENVENTGGSNLKNFGFDSFSKIVENEEIEQVKGTAGKPFRMELNLGYKKRAKQLPDRFAQPVRESDVRRLVDDDPEFLKVIKEDGLEFEKVGLFEDAEVSQNISKCYKPQSRKKFAPSEDNPKKKGTECKLNKDARKWIKEFNQMCDEVENTELEFD